MSRALQAAKIREIGGALSAAGYEHIDSQAEALGLARSTTWTVLQGNHKHSGLTAAVIHQMLKSEKLPASVRRKIIEYVLEKLSGHHGHSKKQILNFSRRISILRAPDRHRTIYARSAAAYEFARGDEDALPTPMISRTAVDNKKALSRR
jgi:hypothetical protein